METIDIKEKIRQLIASVVKHERFEMKDELTAAEVEGWNSLSHMIIITNIEESFNIKFKLRDINRLRDMKTLVEIVQSKL